MIFFSVKQVSVQIFMNESQTCFAPDGLNYVETSLDAIADFRRYGFRRGSNIASFFNSSVNDFCFLVGKD